MGSDLGVGSKHQLPAKVLESMVTFVSVLPPSATNVEGNKETKSEAVEDKTENVSTTTNSDSEQKISQSTDHSLSKEGSAANASVDNAPDVDIAAETTNLPDDELP